MKDEIGCVHFNRCSGCVINFCKNPPILFEHAKHYFANKWQVVLAYKQGAIRGWRTRAKLAVRPPLTIGLFEKGTHKVVEIPECQVHHPKINEAIQQLEALITHAGLTSYDEKSQKGDLRYVQCVVERKTGKVQLSLVLNMQKLTPQWKTLIETLYEPTFWHSIWCNYNDKPVNTIFGKNWEKIAGLDVVWEHIAGLEIAFGPSHFGQANLEMYEKLIFDIQTHVRQNKVVAELYSGIGTIGLSLAQNCKEIRLCELEPHAEQFFTLAKMHLPLPVQKKLSYHVGRTEDCLRLVKGADVCIVDPPRKGLGHDLIHEILCTKGLQQVAYVSCEWKSLERDLDYIHKHFKDWKVTWGSSYLFFPGTNQIETLVFLEKITGV